MLLACTVLDVQDAAAAETVTVGGLTYVNKGLVGVGRLAADLRDKFGETFGSGSGLAADPKSWSRAGSNYRGTLYMLPDRLQHQWHGGLSHTTVQTDVCI